MTPACRGIVLDATSLPSTLLSQARESYKSQFSFESAILAMPFTRKEKAKEKRSRYSDVMSAIEYLDIMLGNYPEKTSGIEPENDRCKINSSSAGLQENSNTFGEAFRSFISSTSRVNI